MNAKTMIEQYVSMCESKNITISTEMLQELERAGRLPPQEQFYPATDIDDEISLYDRIIAYNIRENVRSQEGKYKQIEETLIQLRDICSSCVTDIESIQPALTKLEEDGYTRKDKLLQNYVCPQISKSFSMYLKNLCQGQLLNIKEQDKTDIKQFLMNKITIQASQSIKRIAHQSEIAKHICRFHAIGLIFRKCNQNSQILKKQFVEKVTETASVWSKFYDDVSNTIKEEEQICCDYLQSLVKKMNSKNEMGVVMIVSDFQAVAKLDKFKTTLNEVLVAFLQVLAKKVKQVEDLSQESVDLDQILAKLLSYKQLIKDFKLLKQLFEQVYKETPEAKQAVEQLDNINIVKEIGKQLQKAVQFLQDMQFPLAPALFFDTLSGQLISTLPQNLQQVFEFRKIVADIKIPTSKLPQLLQNMFTTIDSYTQPLRVFTRISNEYNILGMRIKPEMTIIKKNCLALEADIKKAIQGSGITFNCQNGVDESCINKLTKCSDFIANSLDNFLERLNKLQELEALCKGYINQLKTIPIYHQDTFTNCISKLRDEINKFCQSIQAEKDFVDYYMLQNQVQIISIIKNQFLASTTNFQNMFTINLSFDGQLELNKDSLTIQQLLEQNETEYFKIPNNQQFWLTKNYDIEKLFVQLMDDIKKQIQLPTSESIITQLEKIQEEYKQHCQIVALFMQHSDSAFYQQFQKLEEQKVLMDQHFIHLSENVQPIEFILKNDKLTLKTSKPLVFSMKAGCSKLQINFTQIQKAIGQIPNAYLQVGVGAAAFYAEKISQDILNETQVFSQKAEVELLAAKTSQQISAIVDYFEKMTVKVNGELKTKYEELIVLKEIITQQYQQREGQIKLIESAIFSYLQTKDKIGNLNKTLEQRKKDMLEQFTQDLHGQNGIVFHSVSATQEFQANMQKIGKILSEQVVIQKDLKEKCAGTQIFNKQSCVSLKERIESINKQCADADQMISNYDTMMLESKQLFDKQIVTNNDQQKIDTVRQIIKQVNELLPGLQNMLKVQEIIQQIFESEWSICKSRMDLIDDILTNLDFKIVSETKSSLDQYVQQIGQSASTFTSNMKQLFQNSVVIIKLLKSPALMKTHWADIAQKMNFKNICLYFGRDYQVTKVPEILFGQIIYYSLQLYAFEEKQYTSAQNGIRSIVSRAEGELSVRQAVEEIVYWLQTEAKISFGWQELGRLSQEEVNDIINLNSFPLHANWKNVLIALSEKKAVLTSVKANPFSSSIVDQINDTESAIESLTRLALVINQISRQISVLEPVMGRRVLPNEHKKFYQALRLLVSILTQEIKGQKVEGSSVQLQLMPILQTEIQDNLKLNVQQRQAVAQDNSMLGSYTGIITQFEQIQQVLAEVQTALRHYLEQKRLSFPRFYFLADSDVLEILANANSKPEQTINPHCKKLFSSIEKINFEEQGEGFKIISFQSSEGELIELKCQVQISNSVQPELWLNRFDLAVKETLKAEIIEQLQLPAFQCRDVNKIQIDDGFDINISFQKIKTEQSPIGLNEDFYNAKDLQKSFQQMLDLKKCSGESLALAFAVQFACFVDHALFSNNGADAEKFLTQTLDRQTKMLTMFTQRLYEPEISTATFGSNEYVQQLKLKLLAADATHNVNLTKQLQQDPVNRNWIWNREMKCRVYKGSSDIYYIGLDTFMPYTYEYQGLPARLIHTPLTDRCYSTLVSAVACEKSSNPQGPAGTGKTETVKAFTNKLGRPCIVFNCDSAIDRDNLSRILIGIVLSGSVGCFDEVNRLSPAVLSAISTDIENIQKAIALRQTEPDIKQLETQFLTLADITIPISKVSPFAAVFVTMNPASREYRGRSELPFSLVKMLRGCFTGKADVSQIMETILSTSGFIQANIWAEKAELVYLLASRRIPKEVHLDWGLRSLQSVLRQAALQRASIARTLEKPLTQQENVLMEKNVIIKALSDATFSRIQNQSTEIFKEILKDVFGEIQQPEAQKFGAVSQVEQDLVDNIQTEDERLGGLVLQFYRALTSKLGVALLGKSASGKTTIRQLLKQAIEKASNNMIEIREYVIAPKSTSRQDLLGYVDPVTKEWNDGALTKAARTAVQLLNNKEKPYIWSWIVFDGPVESSWIEALNSSLDDNRLLSLSSGERIRFPMSLDPLEAYYSGLKLKSTSGNNNRMDFFIPTPVSFVFETDSLQHASPATVSRLAVILVSDLKIQQQIAQIQLVSKNVAKLCEMLPQETHDRLSEISTHLIMAEDAKDPQAAIRILQSEYQFTEEQINSYCKALNITNDKQSSGSQAQAIKLLETYLKNSQNVMIVGPQQSSKYYCLEQAAQSLNMQLVQICCTSLTTRDDVVRTLTNECVEYTRVDGIKEIKPKIGQHLVICLRNIDVNPNDEYGHNQLFCLLWSILAHKRIYLKQGQYVELKSISFAITAQHTDQVPSRIRRLMGSVELRQIDQSDQEKILGKFNTIYKEVTSNPKFESWLETQANQAETQKLRANVLHIQHFIALPNFLPLLQTVNFSIILQIGKMNLPAEQSVCLVQYFSECAVPFSEGKQLFADGLSKVSKALNSQFVSYNSDQTIPNVKKLLLGTDFVPSIGQQQFVQQKQKHQQISDLLTMSANYIPGLNLFRKSFDKMEQQQQADYLKIISAMESSLQLTNGVITIAQPNSFAFECLTLATLNLQKEIKFISCDNFNVQIIKQLAEKISSSKLIALMIDSASLATDIQWLQFACAIASKDKIYIRSKLNITDLRSLISLYQEKHPQENQTEEQSINQFIEVFMNSISVCLFLNPEIELTDSLLTIAPPLRRRYGIVSLPVNISSRTTSAVTKQIMQTLMPKITNETINDIQERISTYYQKIQPNEQLTYPFQYYQILFLYNIFKNSWTTSLSDRSVQLKSGLNQLQVAQKEVDTLTKQAAQRHEVIQKAQKEANEALVQITAKMELVTSNKAKAAAMEKELTDKEVVIRDQKEKAEKELSQVQPLIEEAKQAVSSIPSDAIAEVKCFNAPPPAVAIVLEAVVRFMGMQDTSWKGMKSFLAQSGVIRSIATLDITTVSNKVLQVVRQHVQANESAFDQVNIQRISRAAAPLARWVTANLKYIEIYVNIEPLMKAAEEANARLSDLRATLGQIKEDVIRLEKEAEQLKTSFDKKTSDLMKYQSELKVIEDKRVKGEKMLSGLVNEKQRWAINEKQLDTQIKQLQENAMSTAVMFALAGNKSDDVREQASSKIIRESIKDLLYNPVFIDVAQKAGLRISQQSLENAALLQNIVNHTGFCAFALSHITDSTGVIEYIRNTMKGAQFVSATSENLSNLISIAARFGQTIIVTDCDQGSIPNQIVPYLRYMSEGYKMSEQGTLADEEENGVTYGLVQPDTLLQVPVTSTKISEVNSKFRIFMISSVSLKIQSICKAKVIELSFAPTEKSRADLYMDEVLKIWSPQTLEKIQVLNNQQASLRSQQSILEETLLKALLDSQKSANILEDEQLLQVLDQARVQQTQIDKAQVQVEIVEKELSELKQQAMQIASVVSQCQYALDLISKLNSLYICDDSAIIPILRDLLIKHSSKQKQAITSEMIQAVISELQCTMYNRLSNMVFTPDKTGALTIYLKVVKPDLLTNKMMQFITGQLEKSTKSIPSWVQDQYKDSVRTLIEILPENIKQKLDFENSEQWTKLQSTISDAQEIQDIQIPLAPNELIKALIIIAFRRDMLQQALQQACESIFGSKLVHNPIQNALALTQGLQQPIIVYTTAGQDPTNTLQSHIIALAPGRESEADEQLMSILDIIGRELEKSKKGNNLIVVKGAHLCIQWLNNLPSQLSQLAQSYNNKYQQDFSSKVKIILLLEPKNDFPAGLSRIAWRICLQQSVSPKQTMLQILREIPEPGNQRSEMNKLYYALFYTVAAIHTILECRRIYAPRGVANDPGWSSMEAITLSQMVAKTMQYKEVNIKDVVFRITGLIIDAVYGVSTKDNCDLELCKQMAELGLHKNMIQKAIEAIKGNKMQSSQTAEQNLQNISGTDMFESYQTFPTIKFMLPPFDVLQLPDNQIKQGLLDYAAKSFQDKLSADQIVLKPSALLTKGEKDSLVTASILSRSSSLDQQSNQQDLFSSILALNKVFNEQVKPKLQSKQDVTGSKTKPILEELSNQYATLVKIVKSIGNDMKEAQEASKNTLLASDHAKLTARLINANVMPETWSAGFQAPPVSVAPIENPELVSLNQGSPLEFIQMIPNCIQAILDAQKQCIESEKSGSKIQFDIQLFPRPQAIMEAIRRYEGSCKNIELDKVQLYATTQQSNCGISFKLKSIQAEGLNITKMDFNVQQSDVNEVYLVAAKPEGAFVPLYVDRLREFRMPVVDVIYIGGDTNKNKEVCLFGVYMHLSGR
ncbi:Dynein_heavy chain [Hexamita inflata]|uniref:Dynein heavy chain n=1 Tax=Hexamita inflata TaxID=28002 RepID=A0AA86PN60_9EUKA|nr:Dynein heavy chain [Hexamita inflata]